MKKKSEFLSENFKFLEVKCSIYLNRRVFVMLPHPPNTEASNKAQAEFPNNVFQKSKYT